MKKIRSSSFAMTIAAFLLPMCALPFAPAVTAGVIAGGAVDCTSGALRHTGKHGHKIHQR